MKKKITCVFIAWAFYGIYQSRESFAEELYWRLEKWKKLITCRRRKTVVAKVQSLNCFCTESDKIVCKHEMISLLIRDVIDIYGLKKKIIEKLW